MPTLPEESIRILSVPLTSNCIAELLDKKLGSFLNLNTPLFCSIIELSEVFVASVSCNLILGNKPAICNNWSGAEELPIIIELVVVLPLSVTSCKVSSWYCFIRFFLLKVTILPTGTIASKSNDVIVKVVSLAD